MSIISLCLSPDALYMCSFLSIYSTWSACRNFFSLFMHVSVALYHRTSLIPRTSYLSHPSYTSYLSHPSHVTVYPINVYTIELSSPTNTCSPLFRLLNPTPLWTHRHLRVDPSRPPDTQYSCASATWIRHHSTQCRHVGSRCTSPAAGPVPVTATATDNCWINKVF